jgi:hypothetical protein
VPARAFIRAEEKERFLNLRAELFWKAADWLKHGNKLLGMQIRRITRDPMENAVRQEDQDQSRPASMHLLTA